MKKYRKKWDSVRKTPSHSKFVTQAFYYTDSSWYKEHCYKTDYCG